MLGPRFALRSRNVDSWVAVFSCVFFLFLGGMSSSDEVDRDNAVNERVDERY